MSKIIKQIGIEGRTTIPWSMRRALKIKNGDFISFKKTPDGNGIIIEKEKICDHCSDKKEPTDENIMVRILSGKTDIDLGKVLFVLENILGLGGGSK